MQRCQPKVCPSCSVTFQPKLNRQRYCSQVCANKGRPDRGHHSPEVIARARDLWSLGLSTSAIGRALGLSKNAIVGISHRNPGFPARPSPIRRRASFLSNLTVQFESLA